MQIILLATAEEAKLPPLTNAVPGPLLPVANRPVMAATLEILARAGHRRLLVSLCQKSRPIVATFGNGRRYGVQIEYVIQRQPWGTAGALKWAARLLNEPFLVLPADMILDLDIAAALAFHQAHSGAATAIVHPPTGRAAPLLRCDAAGRVTGRDAAADQAMAVTGAYLFAPSVLEAIPPQTSFDCYADLLPALLAAGAPVYAWRTAGYWNPLDTFDAYQEAQRVFLHSAWQPSPECPAPELPRVRYPSIEGRQIAPGVWAGANCAIHPLARLKPPVCIGENSWIGRKVELGPEAAVGSHVVVGEGATLHRSTIMDHTCIGPLVNIDRRIVDATTLIDAASGASVQVADPLLLAATRPAGRVRRGARLLSAGGALLLLLLLLPLFMPISLAVWAMNGHPFVRLPHLGRRGSAPGAQTLKLLVFQTRNASGAVSPVGRWLYRWGLVRLPQLWNVLRGDLALVGVQPLHPATAARLNDEWQQQHYEYPAGLTGPWYVEAPAEGDLDAALVADVYYGATRTWRTDLALLARTPIAWLRRHRRPPLRRLEDTELCRWSDKMSQS